MVSDLTLFIGFNILVVFMLVLDLGVFHRKAHVISLREAAIWSVVWIAISLAFGAVIYAVRGAQSGLEFLSGYLIEKSLSVDNIFVFVLIFSYFAVPRQYQHRVLYWGIIGALVMRAIMIFAGAALIERFEAVMYIFGAFLIYTGWRMLAKKDAEPDPSRSPVVRLARRFLPMTDDYVGQELFTRIDGRWLATPLFLVLLVVETSDLLFAVDSIPAVFGVTQDPFIVYTSNVFAILGLRALYFLVAGLVSRLEYLRYGLAAILVFVGAKMLLRHVYEVPTLVSLLVIVVILAVTVAASLLAERRRGNASMTETVDEEG